jgi:hypothetical protein
MRRLLRSALYAGGIALAISLASCAAPGVPAAPVAPPAGAIPGVLPPPAEPQGFFAKCCANMEACRRKLCATPAGQILNGMTKPLTFATGGLIPPFCPIMPSLADMQKPGVAGASDAIKKDALEAKMRREKVRFLGTVDCRYYPDAIGALTSALRSDGSECVRFEAALALNRGCCCNMKTIEALEATVSGTDKDGNPAERSVRVRCAAASALERCLSCYVSPPVDVEEIGEPKKLEPKGKEPTSDSKMTIEAAEKKKVHPDLKLPSKQLVETAWQTLNDFQALLVAEQPRAALAPGERYSVFHIIKNAIDAPEPMVMPTGTTLPPPMATDPGTPAFQAPAAQPGRATLGQPKAEAGPVAPISPIVGQPPTTRPAAEVPAGPLAPSTPMSASAPPKDLPTMPAPAPGATPLAPSINQLIHGTSPAERQAAVRQIAAHDWQKNPAVASALMVGAKNDTSSTVRVECIRQIAANQMSHPQVIQELTALAKDDDANVRDEAAKALEQLKK